MTKRLLITGGAGFIGSCLIKHLFATRENIHITNVDNLSYAGNLENLTDVENNPNYRFVKGDIRDEALVNTLVKEVDIVVNVAAQTHVDRSITGPGIFITTNVLGTQHLLEAARVNTIEKYIQISTDEVYGSIEAPGQFTEDSPIVPSSPYSSSKSAADLIALSYFKTYGLPVCITRCSNNYGPNQYPEKLIPLFILNALANKPLPVYGDGMNVRDWIHVKDHSEAVARVIEDGTAGQVYNVGTNNEWANIDITKTLLKILGKPESLITYVEDRPGHDRRYAIDSGKIQKELGWTPRIDFEQGLKETVEWYQQNTPWVENIQNKQIVSV